MRVFDRILGIVGELLIAAGVLLGLFVVWQLFYTDVQAGRVQDAIIEDFEDQVGAVTAGGSVSEDGVDLETVETIPAEYQFTDDPPVLDEPAHAEVFGLMYVPRWGEDYVKPIAQGTDKPTVLNVIGIGHYEGTAMPGGWGNFSVAAHRTTYGKPFTDIQTIEDGDSVIIETADAWYVYEVTGHEIVLPTAVEVIAPVPDQPGMEADGRYLTMTTCNPRYSAAQRWVVHGYLKYWAPTGHGIPSEMVEEVS
ncbi:class E sortase [Demequina salsinemoris]|uniref:class E sortase n=1 Tax=Demequina salsinemoris TaxID=577470 RepID=UPI000784A4FC|nr:class E sortase [Demequina salsinemoris]